MNPSSAAFWNARYDVKDYIFGTQANLFLTSQATLIQPDMHTLAVADGEGRNSVWLAEKGAQVHAIDVSAVALKKAQNLAASRGVSIRFEEADLLKWHWPEARYDLVVAIFIQFASPLERIRLIAGIRQSLKPGGLLIMQGYTPRQIEFATGGPGSVENMYTRSLLQQWFGDWDIRHMHEHEDFISEGTHHHGMSALVDMVARKP